MKPSEMDPRQWRRVDRVFDRALDLRPEAWPAYLDDACGGDEGLRGEVEALLRAHEAANASLEKSPASLGMGALRQFEGSAPEQLGPFRVIREIGRGGMGVVYLAEDVRLGRAVALKVLPRRPAEHASGQARFFAEARAISALDHPNVATLYEIGTTDDDRLFLAFAYYAGETLEERIRRGPIPTHEALEIAKGIAVGLGAAHAQGIVHGDVKPSNVILTNNGVVKLLDFGVATGVGEARGGTQVPLGTLAYMSPERIEGSREVDHRSDLWALGIVLYEMVTGVRPFRDPNRGRLLRSILDSSWSSEGLDHPALEEVGEVLTGLLAKDPERRYPSIQRLLEDVGDVGRKPAVGRRAVADLSPWHRIRIVLGVFVLAVGVWLAVAGGPPVSSAGALDTLGAVEEALRLGTTHLDRRTPEGIALARRYFERALEADSTSPAALVGLATSYLRAGAWGLMRPADAYPMAKAFAQEALASDSASAGAYAALSEISLRWEWNPEESRGFALRAVELDQRSENAQGQLARALAASGEDREAVSARDRAHDLRTQPPDFQMARAISSYLARDFPVAIEAAGAASAFDTGVWQAPWLVCLAHVADGTAANGLASCSEARRRSRNTAMAVGAHGAALAGSGDRAGARGIATNLERRSKEEYVPATAVAWIYGALGDLDRAFQWMDRAFVERDASLIYLTQGAFFDPLRSDPRFEELLARYPGAPGG